MEENSSQGNEDNKSNTNDEQELEDPFTEEEDFMEVDDNLEYRQHSHNTDSTGKKKNVYMQ